MVVAGKVVAGKTYRFTPPIRAVGFEEGELRTGVPNLQFEIAICVEAGPTTNKFCGWFGNKKYTFFLLHTEIASKLTVI
jgi:hypothetical protein